MTKLKYLSTSRLDTLSRDVESNLEMYCSKGFEDIISESGWSIEHTLEISTSRLKELIPDNDRESEIHNSNVIWEALPGLTPNLAREERVWTRLTHVECIEYTRKRWLPNLDSDSDIVSAIKTHFFAKGRTGIRDDNAVSRLWWNSYIAHLAMPDDPDSALRIIRKSADIRSNIVERSRTSCRQSLLSGIIRALKTNEWLTARERNFREFMIVINRDAGGLLLEEMTNDEIDNFLASSTDKAQAA